ncbi:MAG: acetate--CoA ligase family protein [Clostridia bacterium]|nr:acetate--CoA ligase family protein [Clostridia bacterium]
MYEHVVRPASIAVIGASNDLAKPGGRVIANIVSSGFAGLLWAVNAKDPHVAGVPTFKSVDELPSAPELAIIAIPAPAVRGAMEALASLGARAAVILSAGFGEASEEGKREEQHLLEIARRAGMTLIGPNCMGVLTPAYAGVFAGLTPKLEPGRIDVISGSGATADFLLEIAVERGLPISNVFTVGNAAQVGVEDVLGMMDDHFGPGDARVKIIYMESVRKPSKLLRHSRSLIGKGCSIVGVKSGATSAGSRAAASHTGAMATSDAAVEALFEKAGIIRVKSKSELVDVAGILLTAGALNGRNVCVLTDAGGPGVMLADELVRQGLDLPELGEHTQARLREFMWPGSSVKNPIDCLATRTPNQIEQAMKVISEEERGRIDVAVIIMGDPGMGGIREMYQAMGRAIQGSPIPVIPVATCPVMSRDALVEFRDSGRFFFTEEVALGRALGAVVNRPRPAAPVTTLPGYDRDAIAHLLNTEWPGAGAGPLPPELAARVLVAAGFRLPAQAVAQLPGEVEAACRAVGFPLVMKVIGPIHKTDVGGVVLGVDGPERAAANWERLMSIAGATGVLFQPMVEGTEMIIGAAREGEFGAMVMFGLGGIFTEVLKDVKFALAPLGLDECVAMVNSIRGRRLLDGVRGGRAVDIEAVADCIARVGLLASDFPDITEMDLNPIKGFGSHLYAVDVRIIAGRRICPQ